MATTGVFKRCGCRNAAGQRLGTSCDRLGERGHGTWYFRCQVKNMWGRSEQVRLHDLRHGAATLAHTAGVDIKTIQDQLGHASVVLTADTYTSVLPATHFRAAEATARLILSTARGTRSKIKKKARRNAPQPPAQKSTTAAPASTPTAARNASSEARRPPPAARNTKHPSAAEQHPKPAVDKTTP
jgi:hypothetical protein